MCEEKLQQHFLFKIAYQGKTAAAVHQDYKVYNESDFEQAF